MPDLIFHQFQLGLPPEVLVAFEDELRSGGITDGIFCMGPAPLGQSSVFMMWILAKELRATATIPRSAIVEVEGARMVARELAMRWANDRLWTPPDLRNP